MQNYWQSIWEVEVQHEISNNWTQHVQEKYGNNNQMQWVDITAEEIHTRIKRTANWKTPGKDGVRNYWLKKFSIIFYRQQ